MELLFDSTLGSDTASIDTGAGGIAQTWDHLRVVIYARTTEAVVGSSIQMVVNNDTSSIYDKTTLRLTNTTVAGTTGVGAANWAIRVLGASAATDAFTAIEVTIPSYRQTTGHKQAIIHQSSATGTAADSQLEQTAGRYRATTAISRLAITASSGSLLTGSRMTIYGF